MRQNWISRVAGKYRRSGPNNRWTERDSRDVDARRVRAELDAIRARYPDHR